MRSIKERIKRKMEVLTEVERRRFHVPEKAKVGANVVFLVLRQICPDSNSQGKFACGLWIA